MHQITDQTNQIAEAVSQQVLATDEIAQNIEQINEFATELVEAADDSVQEFREWKRQSIDLFALLR